MTALRRLAFAAAFALPAQAMAAQICLTSKSEGITFAGTLAVVRHTHPNGTPLSAYVLRLGEAVCVHDPGDKDSEFQARTQVREVQLAVDFDKVKNAASLVGKRVRATGDLFGMHTAYHIRPLLQSTTRLEAAP